MYKKHNNDSAKKRKATTLDINPKRDFPNGHKQPSSQFTPFSFTQKSRELKRIHGFLG